MIGEIDPQAQAALGGNDHLDTRRKTLENLKQSAAVDPKARAKLREACQGFETIFLNKMWEQMQANVPKEGYLHSKEESFYRSMYDREMMQKMSESGGVGLGEMLFNQLTDHLGRASSATPPKGAPAREMKPLLNPRAGESAGEAAGAGAGEAAGVGAGEAAHGATRSALGQTRADIVRLQAALDAARNSTNAVQDSLRDALDREAEAVSAAVARKQILDQMRAKVRTEPETLEVVDDATRAAVAARLNRPL